jgi:uncharacterized protein involved in response to NO
MQTQQRTTQTLHHLAAEEEEEIKTQNRNNMEAIKVVAMLVTREGLLVNSSQVDHPQQVTRSNRMLVVVVVELPDITTRMITLLTHNNIQDSLTSHSSNRWTKRKLTITITLVVPPRTRIDLDSSNKISTRKTATVNTSRKDNLMEVIMEA